MSKAMLTKLVILSAFVINTALAAPRCRPVSGPSATQASISKSEYGIAPSPTIPSPSMITKAPGLTCTGGSTVLTTTDCTLGRTYSICYSPPPPIQCSSGFYPGVYHPGHCVEASTCYAVNATWITTTCAPAGGQTAHSTSTLYQGTLAGGQSTIIEQVQCRCADGLYYSWGSSGSGPYCMPQTNCPYGMTTSYSTNEYCLTATANPECSAMPLSYPYCACTTGLPLYPSGGGTPTGCV